MKNSVYIFLFTLVLFQSCIKDNEPSNIKAAIPTCENCSFTCLNETDTDIMTNDCINNWACNFKVFPQSEIDLTKDEAIRVGDKNVFKMENFTHGDPSIADDELTNTLIFELDETQNSFSVENGDLINMHAFFSRTCHCLETESKIITSGCLQGEKQSDGTWLIQGNLVVPYSFGDIDVKFDAQFVY